MKYLVRLFAQHCFLGHKARGNSAEPEGKTQLGINTPKSRITMMRRTARNAQECFRVAALETGSQTVDPTGPEKTSSRYGIGGTFLVTDGSSATIVSKNESARLRKRTEVHFL